MCNNASALLLHWRSSGCCFAVQVVSILARVHDRAAAMQLQCKVELSACCASSLPCCLPAILQRGRRCGGGWRACTAAHLHKSEDMQCRLVSGPCQVPGTPSAWIHGVQVVRNIHLTDFQRQIWISFLQTVFYNFEKYPLQHKNTLAEKCPPGLSDQSCHPFLTQLLQLNVEGFRKERSNTKC